MILNALLMLSGEIKNKDKSSYQIINTRPQLLRTAIVVLRDICAGEQKKAIMC